MAALQCSQRLQYGCSCPGRAEQKVPATHRFQNQYTTATSQCPSLLSHSVPHVQGRSTPCRGTRVTAAAGSADSSQGFNVVITGSTKGVGRAMAEEFLKAGDSVIISSRSEDRVKSAVRELSSCTAGGKVKGISCNVAKAGQVAALASFAKQELGHVDLWVNNAGTNAYKFEPLLDNTEADLISIVETNVLGVMLCCREAVRLPQQLQPITSMAILLMKGQSKGGLIYNMEGAGSDGRPTPAFAAYGATKRSLRQLNGSLQAELKAAKIDNVGIHVLSPGMVTTELLMSGIETRQQAKFFTNVLAESAETSAQYLVPQLRSVLLDGRAKGGPSVGQGKDIAFLTKFKAYSQLAARLVFGSRKNRWIEEAG